MHYRDLDRSNSEVGEGRAKIKIVIRSRSLIVITSLLHFITLLCLTRS